MSVGNRVETSEHLKTYRYTSRDVISDINTGSLFLEVLLGSTLLQLKSRLVPGATIFNFDPTDEATFQASVEVMSRRIKKWVQAERVSTLRILTPESTKSQNMALAINAALQEVTDAHVDVGMFLKAKTEEELRQRLGDNALIVKYTPVTHNSYYIGLSQESASQLRQEYKRGVRFCFLDDVITTGATVQAMEQLVIQAVPGYSPDQAKMFAVARELPEGQSPETTESYDYEFILPEFPHD